MGKHIVVLSIYMTIDADTGEEAWGLAEKTTEELFEGDLRRLDTTPGFRVSDWFCKPTGMTEEDWS